MNMVMLLAAMVFVGVSVLVYSFLPEDTFKKTKKKKASGASSDDQLSHLGREAKYIKEQKEKAEADAKKTLDGYVDLQKQIEEEKYKQEELKQEIQKYKEWIEKDKEGIQKVADADSEIKDILKAKEEELEKAFAENTELKNKLHESISKVQALEEESKNNLLQRQSLAEELKKFKEELIVKEEIISTQEKKVEETSFVSKAEYDEIMQQNDKLVSDNYEVKKTLEAKEKDLAEKEIKLKKAIEQIVNLENKGPEAEASEPAAVEPAAVEPAAVESVAAEQPAATEAASSGPKPLEIKPSEPAKIPVEEAKAFGQALKKLAGEEQDAKKKPKPAKLASETKKPKKK